MGNIIKLTEGDLIKLIKRVLSEEEMEEGLHDTSWENDEGDKITLMDLLNATEDIPVEKISVEELKPHLLTWDGDEKEVAKIDKADLQYPILIFVEDDGSFISIIDGHHRAQKAVKNKLKTIKAKVIPINSLPKSFKKVFGHMGKQEQNEASSPAQQAAIAINMKKKGKKPKVITVTEEQFERLFEYNVETPILMYEDEFGSVEEVDLNSLNEAEYQGRKVQLGKIMQGDVKKSKVYVKNDKGKVVKVNFGFGGKSAHGKRMTIKKNNPERRKSFRARMNCDNPGPRWKPRYWACRTW
jgi:hypothetical protein